MPASQRPCVHFVVAVVSLALFVVVAMVESQPAAAASDRASAATGSLTVNTAGLPRSVKAAVIVRGPGLRPVRVVRSRILADLQPGIYRITINPVQARGGRYFASRRALQVGVRAKQRARVQARYANFLPARTKPLSPQLARGVVVQPSALLLPAAAAHRYRRGDVIVIGVGPNTPMGLIRRVTRVGPELSGQVTIATATADLRDALPQGELTLSGTASGQIGDAAPGTPQRLARISVRPVDLDLGHNFLERTAERGGCKANAGLKSTGRLSVTTTFDLRARWSLAATEVSFDAELDQRASAGFAASVSGECGFEYDTPSLPLGVHTVLIGPVPVVIVPQLYGTIAAKAAGALEASAGGEQRLRVAAGLTASSANGVSTRRSVEPTFTASPPTLTELSGQATLEAGPVFGLQLYGVTGLQVSATAGLDLNVEALKQPAWTLDGTVRVEAAVNLLGLKAERTLFESSNRLLSAPTPRAGSAPGSPAAPSDPLDPGRPAPPKEPGPTLTSIAVGAAHSCALAVGGAVYCWGDNWMGQLADDSREDRPRPVKAINLTGAIEIAAGGLGTCAALGTGEVRCWGVNGLGQVGDGTTETRFRPSPVSGLSDARSVSVGSQHACALRASGSVVCWGWNSGGRLGDGTEQDRTTPVAVMNLSDATMVSAGAHTCAVRSGGTVSCWGDNHRGQLGDGTTTRRSVPGPVSGITTATQVSAGAGAFSCARLAGGTVACWGDNREGQLAHGTFTGRNEPVIVAGLSDAVRVAAGLDHACAVRIGGRVACWGSNLGGRAGHQGPTERFTAPNDVAGLEDATDLSVDIEHACARRSGGGVACWGSNDDGKLGGNAEDPPGKPVQVLELPAAP